MATPAGEFNRKLRLESPPALGRRGRLKGSWVFVANVWAKIETLGGQALLVAQQSYDGAQVRVTIRTRTVRHGMRFVYAPTGQAYEIGHVEDPNLAHEDVICLCNALLPSASPADA